MNQETYISMQISNIDHAIKLGENVINTSRTLNNMKNKNSSEGGENAFFQDSMKYFNFSDAIASIEFLPLQVKDFKNQLIEIKMENDKMLLEGGFIPAIDQEIANIFRPDGFGSVQINISKIKEQAESAIVILNRLKDELK